MTVSKEIIDIAIHAASNRSKHRAIEMVHQYEAKLGKIQLPLTLELSEIMAHKVVYELLFDMLKLELKHIGLKEGLNVDDMVEEIRIMLETGVAELMNEFRTQKKQWDREGWP